MSQTEKNSWFTFLSHERKVNLFGMLHTPASSAATGKSEASTPFRILFVFHGQGEHCGRYAHFPKFLDGAVDLVATMDHRGHGRSEGVRGHVDRFQDYVEDARLFVQTVIAQYSEGGRHIEAHLFGHSMGGLVALRLLQTHPELSFASATLSAPLLGLKFEVPLVKKFAGHVLSRVMGGVQLPTGLDSALISHDAAIVDAYRSDRLVHDKASARFFTEMLEAIHEANEQEDGIRPPLMLIVPGDDGLVDSEATLDFVSRLQHSEKKIVQFPGFYHESFNEVEKDKAFAELRRWIDSHRLH